MPLRPWEVTGNGGPKMAPGGVLGGTRGNPKNTPPGEGGKTGVPKHPPKHPPGGRGGFPGSPKTPPGGAGESGGPKTGGEGGKTPKMAILADPGGS